MTAEQITQLRSFADMALPMSWEANDSTVPHLCKRDFQKAATPTVIIELLNERVELRELAERIARLNPDAGEIGAGMLAQLVAQARGLIE